VTAFESKVYDLCRKIPEGRVATYGSMAKALGCGAARAIGQAMRRNPFAPEVPCHRVVSSDLQLGGFRLVFRSSDERYCDACMPARKNRIQVAGVPFCA